MLVHGGGWSAVGPSTVAATVPNADFFRNHGWGTYNIDYRAGSASLTDVLSAYDFLRGHVGPNVPVCAWGGSAGGNLALLLAGERPGLACVISEAGPTDLLTLGSEPAYAPPGETSATGPQFVVNKCAVPMLGSTAADLWWWSPVRLATRMRAHLLLGTSTQDPLVPAQQMWDLASARPDFTRTMLLPAGNAPFTHAGITPAALSAWQAAELTLLSNVLKPAQHGRRDRPTRRAALP